MSETEIADAMCLACGEVKADADGRCPRCSGRAFRTTTRDQVDVSTGVLRERNGHAPPAPPPTPLHAATATAGPVFKLPGNHRNRRWIEETAAIARGLRDSGQAAAKDAQDRNAEAQRLLQAAGALDQVLRQVQLAEEPARSDSPNTKGLNRGRVWKVGTCQGCGFERKLFAQGLCMKCHRRRG